MPVPHTNQFADFGNKSKDNIHVICKVALLKYRKAESHLECLYRKYKARKPYLVRSDASE